MGTLQRKQLNNTMMSRTIASSLIFAYFIDFIVLNLHFTCALKHIHGITPVYVLLLHYIYILYLAMLTVEELKMMQCELVVTYHVNANRENIEHESQFMDPFITLILACWQP